MTAIRVLLGDMTPMFHSLVTGLIGACDDVELLCSKSGTSGDSGLSGQDVDVLMIRSADIVDCPAILAGVAQSAPLGVVAVGDDGHSGTCFRVERQPVQFAVDGHLDLIAAIRSAAGRT